MKEPVELEDAGLYVQRMVVLLETEPQSNKYCQMLFNAEQFKKVSDCISSVFAKPTQEEIGDAVPRHGFEIVKIEMGEEEIELPSEIQDITP